MIKLHKHFFSNLGCFSFIFAVLLGLGKIIYDIKQDKNTADELRYKVAPQKNSIIFKDVFKGYSGHYIGEKAKSLYDNNVIVFEGKASDFKGADISFRAGSVKDTVFFNPYSSDQKLSEAFVEIVDLAIQVKKSGNDFNADFKVHKRNCAEQNCYRYELEMIR